MNKWDLLNKNYLDKGLKIFPVIRNGKTPLLEKWQHECSSDYMQVLYWYENAKDCNWGLPATQNGLFVIDIDNHDINGLYNFEQLLDEIGLLRIDTLMQTTPSGGVHVIFKTDEDLKNIPNSSNSFPNYPGIDIRTDGYIVVEPSIINDTPYYLDDNLKINDMPQKLKEYILKTVGTKQETKKTPYEKPKEVFVGDRDNQLFQYINNLYYRTRLDYDEILVLAKYFNNEILEEPFNEKTVEYKVKKCFEKNRGNCIFIRLGEEDNDNR